jgi:hypothetical protein
MPLQIYSDLMPNIPLRLAGVGMRKKNVLFVDVDIYLIGIHMPSASWNAAAKWNSSDKSVIIIYKCILNNNNHNNNNDYNNVYKLASIPGIISFDNYNL